MIQIENNEVFTTTPETHKIRRKGTNTFYIKGTILPTDTIDEFEELTKEEVEEIEKLEALNSL